MSRHYVVPHISTGDMLRSAVKEDTAFGRRAKEIMDRGELVSDDIMIGIVEERLSKRDSRNRGYILDGFPRTVAQAVALIDITQERPIDLVVDLEVPREVVLARLASRRVCVDCGANYSLENKPAHPWTCDFCGGDVIQRADDTEDAIMRRLALYDEQTAPLHEFYAKRGELAMVDGVGQADTVLNRVIDVIEERRERGIHA